MMFLRSVFRAIVLVGLASGVAMAKGSRTNQPLKMVTARAPVSSSQLDAALKNGVGNLRFPMLSRRSIVVSAGRVNPQSPPLFTLVHPKMEKLNEADRSQLRFETANIRTLFSNVSTIESQ